MTRHYPDLGGACDWLKKVFPCGSANQKHYGISALISQTSFRGETSVDGANDGYFHMLSHLKTTAPLRVKNNFGCSFQIFTAHALSLYLVKLLLNCSSIIKWIIGTFPKNTGKLYPSRLRCLSIQVTTILTKYPWNPCLHSHFPLSLTLRLLQRMPAVTSHTLW